jgi:hypothetical protein
MVFEGEICCWTNYHWPWMDHFHQHVVSHPSTQVPHQGKICQTNIRKDRFWDTCANFMHMVEHILVAHWGCSMTNNLAWGRHNFSWRHWNMSYDYEINHFHYHWVL